MFNLVYLYVLVCYCMKWEGRLVGGARLADAPNIVSICMYFHVCVFLCIVFACFCICMYLHGICMKREGCLVCGARLVAPNIDCF